MSSERQIKANQENGRLSFGPRTTEGKQRSRANATRHGLSSSPSFDRHERDILVALLADGSNAFDKHEAARGLIDCELELRQVRQVRVNLLSRAGDFSELGTGKLRSLLTSLTHIERYERRIRSRRKRALQKLPI